MLSARGLVTFDLLVTTDLVCDLGSPGVVKHRGSLLWVALRLTIILAMKLRLND